MAPQESSLTGEPMHSLLISLAWCAVIRTDPWGAGSAPPGTLPPARDGKNKVFVPFVVKPAAAREQRKQNFLFFVHILIKYE